ncbi:MAG TPA: UDP-N-acetylmuramate--L-alanine ligase [Dehalococcoidia bacterium]|nr:UDP-N-acetylmuramate--L-alanine ligase [Dehalococcoidia bacterium]
MPDAAIPGSIHLVGIGGAHMSAIARILLSWGHSVSGSDLRRTPLTDAVEALGARVVIGPHDAANVGEVDLVVTTSAALTTNPELAEAQRRGIPVIKRAEMVARLMAGKVGVGVAGCHGKSTTSGMVAFILREAGRDPTYLIGAELSDRGSNAAAGLGEHVVVEADEYDRAFLSYHPRVALVTNVEADHLDYYKTWEAVQEAFRTFAGNVEPGGTLVLCANDAEALSLRDYVGEAVNVVTYALDQRAEWRASEVVEANGAQTFNVYHHGVLVRDFSIRLAQRHMVQNALGAIVVCVSLGLTPDEIAPALARYGGVRRRFEAVGESAGVMVMDDYAHHPTEIAALAPASHARFPGRRIVALFQPHTYARSRYLLDGFKTCFTGFDRLFILETYAAREAIADGLTGAQLAAEITDPTPGYCETFESAAETLAAELRPGDVFFTIGAGDVDCVGPMVLDRLRARVGAGLDPAPDLSSPRDAS